jgi:hypothetical protein
VFREPGRDPAIIMPAVSLDQYAQSQSEIKDVRIYNPFYYFKTESLDHTKLSGAESKLARIYFEQPIAKGLVESLGEVLRERGLVGGRIGSTRRMPTNFAEIFRRLKICDTSADYAHAEDSSLAACSESWHSSYTLSSA